MAKFKQEVLDKIKSDIDLYVMIGKALGLKPLSIQRTVARNGNALNQYSIVKLVSDYLKVDPEELVEEMEVTAK